MSGPQASPSSLFSLYFSLLPGNLKTETGSIVTASATNQSPHGGDFPERRQIPAYWRLPARSTWSLDFRTLPRRTLWPFCLCTLKSLFPGNGDRLDLRLVRGWEATRLRRAQRQIYASPSRTARPRFIRGAAPFPHADPLDQHFRIPKQHLTAIAAL